MNTQADINDSTYFAEIKIDDGKWTREQTQILIETWKHHKDILLNTASSLSEHFRIWKIIASEVNKLSPPKSLQQCKKKFRNIRYICKTAMNNNKQPGAKKHYPMFYSEFVKILSESQRLMFGDKIKFELSSDELSEYNNIGESMPLHGETSSESLGIEYDQNEASLNKCYYLHRDPNYNSPNSSAQNSPSSNDAVEATHADENGSPLISVMPVGTDGKETVGIVKPNGMADNLSQSGEELSQNADEEINKTLRKHRHNDVSIMGRGYPPSKRARGSVIATTSFQPQSLIHHKSIPSHKVNNDFYPTMASISQEIDHLATANNLATSTAAFTKVSGKYETHREHVVRNAPSKKQNSDNSKNNYTPNGGVAKGNLPPNANMMEMFQERFLDLQERQMELFNDMLNRHEQFLLSLLQQQREAAEEAQQRDRNFMFRLVEIFLKQK